MYVVPENRWVKDNKVLKFMSILEGVVINQRNKRKERKHCETLPNFS